MSDSRLTERNMREFLAEANEIIEGLSSGFAEVDKARAKGKAPSPAHLNEVFRRAHSLKGLAGMFNMAAISSVAHEMETLLDGLRLGKLNIDDNLMQVLYICNDTFTRLLTAVRNGDTPDETATADLVVRIQELASGDVVQERKDGFASLQLPKESLSVLTEYEEHRLTENLRLRTPIYRVNAPLDLATFDEALGVLTEALNNLGEVITTLPSVEGTSDGINFDIILASTDPIEDLSPVILSLGSYTVERVDRRTEAHAAKENALPAPASSTSDFEPVDLGTLRQISDTVRVDISKLDELMGIVGELVLTRAGLSRAADELKREMVYRGSTVDLHRLINTLARRVADLQGAIMQVRMIPMGQVFDRLSARIVRKTASELDKEVELLVSGEETELDKLIVEELIDPLMHLVRNAVDHGIESPEVREALGKPRNGTIHLRAYPRGNHVVIEIQDDGGGIDEYAVKRTALERGVVDEERVGTLTSKEVWSLIFNPGLTTRKTVTETSGRGVGLDVVKTNISRLSGIIDVDSVAGEGTKFSITLPISLAILQALIVRSHRSVFALPLASVLEILAVEPGSLCNVDGREMIRVRDATLPILHLAEAFGLRSADDVDDRSAEFATDEYDEQRQDGYIAVVGLAHHRLALMLDDVTGQQDIVIKSLGSFLKDIPGIAGATQMGDHETILVLDVGALVQEFVVQGETFRAELLRKESK
ncbi:MAG: chemotaxis protein CheA [Deltaproteobacteria bacterium]|nr:chemotaxis protein CheA [Deltaproteobacteria bacterium]